MGGYAPVISPDDDERERQRQDYEYPPVPAIHSRDINAPGVDPRVAALSAPSGIPAYPPPIVPAQSPAQTRLHTLTEQGAPPVQPLHGFKKFLDIASQFTKPTQAIQQAVRYRPQREYAGKLKQAEGDVAAEQAPEKTQADIAEKEAQAEEAKARAEGLRNPQPKIGQTGEEQTLHDLMTGDKGNPRVNPQTGKPYSYMEAYQAVKQAEQGAKPAKTPNDFEQFYADWLKDNSFPDTAHNRLVARKEFAAAGQPPQHEPRQLAVGPDGKVIELRPGVTVPQGSTTVSGDLTHKPNADEQKRADLVENLNENLDQLEDIVTRRPDLFGKLSGRITKLKEWTGSDDPDVAALKGIEDRLGMVQQSSHGMRSAQHVEQSAQSVLNGFKNGPDAMKRAIADARKSGATFTQDVERAKAGGTQPFKVPDGAPAAPKEDGHKLKVNGKVTAVSKGGKWVVPQ